MYYHLHAHTTKGSIGDSIIKIPEYIDKAKEMGLDTLAITEHGSLSTMYEFYLQCKENNIKPIIGVELYEAPNRLYKEKPDKDEPTNLLSNHLVVLAKDSEGLKSLLNITSDASINGFYKKPRTDIAFLKDNAKNLIGLSACLGSKIAQLLLMHTDEGGIDYQPAIDAIEEYKTIFDKFYLEIQPGDFEDQIFVNNCLVELSVKTDTPLVVTSDIHYLNQEDYQIHDWHIKAIRKQSVDDPLVYPDTCYYMMTEEEVINSLSYIDKSIVQQAIDNTVVIANQCNIELEIETHMPEFEVEEGYTEETYLAKICYDKLNDIKDTIDDPSAYVERLEHELEVIKELGFCGYFLTVKDLLDYARSENIAIGPGRGSVNGSLVGFLTKITAVDPVKYDLLFERFLDKNRVSNVDIDIDASSRDKEALFKYSIEKYGFDNCALVSTFQMRKARAAIKDAGRVCDIDKATQDIVSKLIPQVYYDDEGEKLTDLSIIDSIACVPELEDYSQAYPKWFELALALEDLPKATSIHPAGTLISPVRLHDYIPLSRNKNSDMLATALCLDDAEDAGFLKFDYLSLASLDVIGDTEKLTGDKFDYSTDTYDDQDVWNLIGSKNTIGLFQISSPTYRQRMGRLRPKSLKELSNCLALVRGPCISSGQDKLYMDILEGTQDPETIHPLYDSATKETHYIMIFQESLMQVCVNFGFSLADGYGIMKAVSSKKMNKIKEYEEMFYSFGADKGVKSSIVEKIFKTIVEAGQYLFNASHSLAYSQISYCTAYYKYHYPIEYMVSFLNNAYTRKEGMKDGIQECRRLGIQFLPPDVNLSSNEFTIEDGFIRVGLMAIKSFGVNAAEELIANRPYDSLEDVLNKVTKGKCGKRALIPAIFGGLFSSFNENRPEVYKEYMELNKEEPLTEIKLQGNQTFKVNASYDSIETLILDSPIISSPINDFNAIGYESLKQGSKFTISGIIRNVKKIKTKNKQDMCFLETETADGDISFVVFPNKYTEFKSWMKKGLLVDIVATKDKEDSSIFISIS